MKDLEFREPSMDLSCGDGLFSFLMAGGKLDPKFDIFHATDNLDDFFDNADIYNATTETYSPPVKKHPERSITVGTDWKQDLLDKAAELDFYDELVEHDNNDPLPFDDDRFMTVFSNSAYWVENIDLHLSEIARVTDPEGRVYLQLKLSHITDWLETLWDDYEDFIGGEVIEMIDRGRSDNKKHLHTDTGWHELLESAGLEVVESRTTATQLHSRMWDIGLRPISPYLIRMANGLPPEERNSVKADWVDTFEKMLSPFTSPTVDYRERPPAEKVYVLRPE
jgi:SAM-dependent methyltransferase